MAGRVYHIGILLISMVLIAGCATKLHVTYSSDPPGAFLYSGNQSLGFAPQTIPYTVTKADRKRGYMEIKGASVRWASGARAEIQSLQTDLKNGLNQQYMFVRPENYPGISEDMRFALEVERLSIERSKIQAAKDEAIGRAFQETFQQQLRQQPKTETTFFQPQPRSGRNCTSRVVGNTIYTNCD